VSTPARIIRTYLAITALFNLAASLIWGVDTLFKLHAGLDIFQVMLTNAAFTLGMTVFEIPTGVVADTLGRRVSFLLSVATLLVGTMAYVAIGWRRWGFWPFVWVSIVLGLGYTFYTGAVDAWLVDALKASGYSEPLEPIFARGQMAFGGAMLVGTLAGGALGQIQLFIPYLARAATFVPLIAIAWWAMPEIGHTPRTLEWRRVPEELRRVFIEGLDYGVHHAVVRPVMLASLVNMSFMIFGFYSWQRYFLDLLGRELVWVSGLIASLLSLSMIVGNVLVRRLSATGLTRPGLLGASAATQALLAAACGILGLGLGPGHPEPWRFWLVVPLYLLYGVALGVMAPVKQGYLNDHIPSAQRATVISLDSLFADLGGAAGQSGWGYLARMTSLPVAWVFAGAVQGFGVPLYRMARAGEARASSTDVAPFTPGTSEARSGGGP